MPNRATVSRLSLSLVMFCILANRALAGEPTIQFDVPALIPAEVLEPADSSNANPSQKIIELVVPVTSVVTAGDRDDIDEFRFDIFWNRNVYPLEDYSPKTQTFSEVDGLITVEKHKNRNAGIGIDLDSGFRDVVSGHAKADVSQQNGTRLKYQEVPQHEVLVASGTVKRSTGAFFRFHPSRRDTLEGGRDLVVAFRVPQSWRGGVVTVECRAQGHRKILGSWRETFEQNRAFVLPIYLDGDDQARQAAEDFVRSEQSLRQNWQCHIRGKSSSSAMLAGFVPRTSGSTSSLPKQWVHYLIQSGNDEYLTRYRSKLPQKVADAAEQFVSARQDLFQFSR